MNFIKPKVIIEALLGLIVVGVFISAFGFIAGVTVKLFNVGYNLW